MAEGISEMESCYTVSTRQFTFLMKVDVVNLSYVRIYLRVCELVCCV